MKFRTLKLGSAALVGVLLVGVPVGASAGESTPGERAQTDRLNAGVSSANAAAQNNYDADRDAYERSLNSNDRRQANYDADRGRYDAQHPNYDRSRSERWNAFNDSKRYRDIAMFQSDELSGKMVVTRAGERVGRISDVSFLPDRRVNRIAIQVRHQGIVWVYADDLRYDRQSQDIISNLTIAQVDSLPHMKHSGI